MRLRETLTILALFLGAGSPAYALTIVGEATVIKPYAFTLEGYEVYLLGIDSMEQRQTCTIGRQQWECWAPAYRQLEIIVSEGDVTCETVFGPDDAQRVIALCAVNGEDIGARFVMSGFGLTIPKETTRYNQLEDEAQEAGVGLWQGQFTPPAFWRSLPMRPVSNRPFFDPAAPID